MIKINNFQGDLPDTSATTKHCWVYRPMSFSGYKLLSEPVYENLYN